MEYGKVSPNEVKATSYENDKGAEAVVLFDKGESHFVEGEEGFKVLFERLTRIKVLSDAGKKWTDFEIPYYHEEELYEKIYELKGVVYNYESGYITKTPLDLSLVNKERINNNWDQKLIAMPNVREGSVVELKYKIESPYYFNLQDWRFQWGIPVVYSEYITKMTPYFEYTWLLQGANKFDLYETYKEQATGWSLPVNHSYSITSAYDVVQKYAMKNVEAFNDEGFIGSMEDYIIKLDFQLSRINYLSGGKKDIFTTWDKLIEGLLKKENFGRYLKKSTKNASEILDHEKLVNISSREKFNIVLNFVKNRFKWNEEYGIFASKTLSKTLDDGYGNSADINLMTAGLLNGVGIKSYPVIISTRKHGKIRKNYPFVHFFNYVVVLAEIDGEVILTDATDLNIQNDRIPAHCINDVGLIIKKDEESWTSLVCNFPSIIKTSIIIDIEGMTLSVQISKSATEYDALHLRKTYGNDRKKLKKKFLEDGYNVEESNIDVDNMKDLAKSYNVKYRFNKKAEYINNKIYISPFFNEIITENPLKRQTRNYPIEMLYPKLRVFLSSFKIPQGYKLDYIAENYKIDNENFTLQYKSNIIGDFVQVSYSYYFKKSIYPANDYLKLKLYFKEIVKKANEKVVLVKI